MKDNLINSFNSFFFLHIPKCGGNSIIKHMSEWFENQRIAKIPNNEQFIDAYDSLARSRVMYGHQFYPFINLLKPPVFMITFLRNPVERTISAYEYIKRKKDHIYHKQFETRITNLIDFCKDSFFRFHSSNMQTRMLGADYSMTDIIDNLKRKSKSSVKALIHHEETVGCSDKIFQLARERLEYFHILGIVELFKESIMYAEKIYNFRHSENIYMENKAPVDCKTTRFCNYTEAEISTVLKYNEYDIQLYDYAYDLFLSRYNSITKRENFFSL